MTNQKIVLNGNWQLQDESGECLCDCTVPGSVLSAMLDAHLIEDPYYRMNEYPIRELLKKDYSFTRSFLVERQENLHYELVCDGIDTVADIYLNGEKIESVDNMHLQYRIPCGTWLKDGENRITVTIHSPITYVDCYEAKPEKQIDFVSTGVMKGSQYIRKAHSMFGWDWGPQLPDMGIWQNISIVGYEKALLDQVRIHQEHTQKGVTLRVESQIRMASSDMPEKEAKVLSEQELPEGWQVCYALEEEPQAVFKNGVCHLSNPRLWWPRGYGEQPLYGLRAELCFHGEVMDTKKYRIGLRTMTVSTRSDEWGNDFAICVNGVRIFAKGADYIPEDCIYSRITKERQEFLLDSAAEAGFNCLRIWGGGYYPSDAFYDMCDEKGILLWQDFMFACNLYDLTPQFEETVRKEVRYQVARLRHHASLALWCGNNEMEYAWEYWEGYRDHSDALRQDYLKLFEEIIPEEVAREDDTVFYWPSSPSGGGQFKDLLTDGIGDCHYWEVWHGEKPFTDYENHNFRFCSEFGFQSFPELKTIESFTLPEDRNIFTRVMESHQKNGVANGKILKYISDNFRYPSNLDNLAYVSQIMQGIAMKSGVDHWRRHRGECMGALYWQLNDNWPVASWASIDYYGRWKALHYMARHFYADVVGTLQISGYEITPYVQNETREKDVTKAVLTLRNRKGEAMASWEQDLGTEPLSVTHGQTLDLEEQVKGQEWDVLLEAVFYHGNGQESHQVYPFVPYKHLNLLKAHISHQEQYKDGQLTVTLQSDAPALFVELRLEGADVVWSDNYFHMVDQKPVTVTAKLPEGMEKNSSLSVRSLCDSYDF